MIVLIDKRFEKDTNKINDKSILKKIASCIIEIQNSDSLNKVKNLKKLKGFDSEYRIKIVDYRIGLIIENKVIFLSGFFTEKTFINSSPNSHTPEHKQLPYKCTY